VTAIFTNVNVAINARLHGPGAPGRVLVDAGSAGAAALWLDLSFAAARGHHEGGLGVTAEDRLPERWRTG
jgi:hypothetical protein